MRPGPIEPGEFQLAAEVLFDYQRFSRARLAGQGIDVVDVQFVPVPRHIECAVAAASDHGGDLHWITSVRLPNTGEVVIIRVGNARSVRYSGTAPPIVIDRGQP